MKKKVERISRARPNSNTASSIIISATRDQDLLFSLALLRPMREAMLILDQ